MSGSMMATNQPSINNMANGMMDTNAMSASSTNSMAPNMMNGAGQMQNNVGSTNDMAPNSMTSTNQM